MIARIVTGLVLTAVVLGVVVWGPFEAIAVLLAAAILPALWEFLSLLGNGAKTADRVTGLLAGGGILAAAALAPHDELLKIVLVANANVTVGLLLVVLFNAGPMQTAGPRAAHLIAGVTYVALLGSFAVMIARAENGDQGRYALLMAAAVTWAGDSAAFFGGKTLGRHKLYEAVSPKKTWEGSIAGLMGSVLGAFAIRWLLWPEVEWPGVLAFALVGGALGQAGDLAESVFKRSYGVKDSGTILPGHGGLLDRIDAFLFVAPLAYFWFVF